MLVQITSILFSLALTGVKSEPPNSQYGTPLGAPISSYGTPNYNAEGHNHEYSEPKAYEFGYQVKDDYSGNNYNRQEASDGNQVRGEYRVQLPDGRTQIVTYYADWQTGYHADVRYEGTANYPDQYNQHQQQHGSSGGYSAPGFGGNSGQGNFHGGHNDNYNSGGYSGSAATSSVTIKDYCSGPNTPYNTGSNGYNNLGQNYDNYNTGGFPNKIGPTPVYGAP